MFSTSLALLLAGSELVHLAACMPARSMKRGSTISPDIPGNFADPAAMVQGDATYAYSTTSGGANVPYKINAPPGSSLSDQKFRVQGNESTAIKSLDKVQDAMPDTPKWSPPGKAGVWAPDVIQLASGSFVLYFSATSAQDPSKHCIGAATSDSATGPFKPQDDPFACPLAQGGAIDPSGFIDTDGKVWVVYKVDGNSLGGGGPCGNSKGKYGTPIMLQNVDPKDGVTRIGNPQEILNREKHDGPLIEAPSLIKSKDGIYVLFFSSNCYNTPLYDISYATSDRLTSGYKKANKPLLVQGNYGLNSPGGATAYSNKDGSKIVFHADKDYGDASVREMYESGISIDAKTRTVTLVDVGKNDMASS